MASGWLARGEDLPGGTESPTTQTTTTTMAGTMRLVRVSAYPSLLRVLYVLYRQGMHGNTHTHIPYQLRGISGSPSKRIDHEAQPHTNSSSQPPIFYVPTYKPTYLQHHARKCRSAARLRSQTSFEALHFSLYAG